MTTSGEYRTVQVFIHIIPTTWAPSAGVPEFPMPPVRDRPPVLRVTYRKIHYSAGHARAVRRPCPHQLPGDCPASMDE